MQHDVVTARIAPNARALVDAIKRPNSTDPMKILAIVPSTDFEGGSGGTGFHGSQRRQHRAILIFTAEGSQI
jgi:hypothetical protein